ncbi:hypothetical protein EJ03DRAFT_174720 [Teratosphaeria nubilosa]|uniref:Uncharacterized protein n=1 Tax=Teratosphaeria nubilosa TaxID=161662 RepID=A0A6G1L130_9PEZI|nr:hypothetical protein EJ03DRAFT_174720 [Teratosphaeria nubilosa]
MTLRTERTKATQLTRNTRLTSWTAGGLRNERGELLANQVPGAIVYHEETRRNKTDKIPDGDPRVSYRNGVRYVIKGRYWLIVKRTEKNVWECPIYSNNNTGLELVEHGLWSQYASLVPKGQDPHTFKNQSPGNKMVIIDWMDSDRNRHIRDTAAVHLAGAVQRPVDRADMKVVGTIQQDQIEEVSRKALSKSGW